MTERTSTLSVSPAHPYLWGRGGRDGRLPGHEAGRDALHDPGEARRAMVLPSRPGVGGEPQDLGRTRAVHHVHHRYTTEGVLPIVAGCCHTRDLALISRFCNLQQHMATYVGGLWVRRSRVRAPSVTPRSQVKTRGSDFRRDLVYCNPLRRLVGLRPCFGPRARSDVSDPGHRGPQLAQVIFSHAAFHREG